MLQAKWEIIIAWSLRRRQLNKFVWYFIILKPFIRAFSNAFEILSKEYRNFRNVKQRITQLSYFCASAMLLIQSPCSDVLLKYIIVISNTQIITFYLQRISGSVVDTAFRFPWVFKLSIYDLLPKGFTKFKLSYNRFW